jgi:hypothetical protein
MSNKVSAKKFVTQPKNHQNQNREYAHVKTEAFVSKTISEATSTVYVPQISAVACAT